ncbi:MAG TPA: tetratricopeptide repeat protein [Syntrophobacteraceae bacterium]|nr:tetratricopeptide repeat protein [Syntrophobacteraceae bacterium]
MADSADKIETYRQMLKLDRRSRVFTMLAEQLCTAGKWEEAAEVCKKGLVFHPDHLRSRALLGWALMEMGEADRSERIFLQAANDIRKNSVIFKLLSELATASGNIESAGQYAGIYAAFQAAGAARSKAGPAVELHPEPASPPDKELSELEEFKAEAIEELRGQDMDTDVLEEPGDLSQEPPSKPPGLDEILLHLVQRIEGRFTKQYRPAAILSEEDKIMLKQKVVAVLGA